MTDRREDRMRARAHALWESEGRPEGRALDHWLGAEREEGGDDHRIAASDAHPDDVDRAAGPSHGDEDFGGHDAEAEGAAAAGIGGQKYRPGDEPKQAGTNEPEVGEEQVRPGLASPDRDAKQGEDR